MKKLEEEKKNQNQRNVKKAPLTKKISKKEISKEKITKKNVSKNISKSNNKKDQKDVKNQTIQKQGKSNSNKKGGKAIQKPSKNQVNQIKKLTKSELPIKQVQKQVSQVKKNDNKIQLKNPNIEEKKIVKQKSQIQKNSQSKQKLDQNTTQKQEFQNEEILKKQKVVQNQVQIDQQLQQEQIQIEVQQVENDQQKQQQIQLEQEQEQQKYQNQQQQVQNLDQIIQEKNLEEKQIIQEQKNEVSSIIIENIVTIPISDNNNLNIPFQVQDQSALSPRSNALVINQSQFVMKKKGKVWDQYNKLCELGKGGMGVVFKAEKVDDGAIYAVKMLNKMVLRNTQVEIKDMLAEIELQKKLDHPNIAKVFGYYEDMFNYYIIEEFIQGKELLDIIQEKDFIDELETAQIIKQILSALQYAHKHGVIHRDIKPDNILIYYPEGNQNVQQSTTVSQGESQSYQIIKKQKGSDKAVVKVIDWGMAISQKSFIQNNQKITLNCGTLDYVSPECFMNKGYDGKKDIWAVGCILYLMLAMSPPFTGSNDQQTIEKIKIGKCNLKTQRLEKVSEEGKDLIAKLLAYRPEQRLDAEQAIKHKWFEITDKDLFESREENQKFIQLSLDSLKNYRAESKLKEASLSFLAAQVLTEKEKSIYKEIFNIFDKNNDGTISQQELVEGYQKMQGLTHEQAAKEAKIIMQEVDMDKNGAIEYNEFLSVMLKRKQLLSVEKLKKSFAVFDKDGDGYISSNELQTIIGGDLEQNNQININEQVWKELISEADENGDGQISWEEYLKFMTNFHKN